METQLSKNLTLAEAITSQTATRLGINNQPSPLIIKKMELVAQNIFQKIRDHFGKPVRVSSFYRSPALNKRIGGSTTSQHCLGEAIDLQATAGFTNKEIFEYVRLNLKFDQLIGEFPDANNNFEWVHVSFKEKGNRNQILIAKKVKGKTVYVPFK
jgi:zinc D-Ala-D-Ala carboxypeptidase